MLSEAVAEVTDATLKLTDARVIRHKIVTGHTARELPGEWRALEHVTFQARRTEYAVKGDGGSATATFDQPEEA